MLPGQRADETAETSVEQGLFNPQSKIQKPKSTLARLFGLPFGRGRRESELGEETPSCR